MATIDAEIGIDQVRSDLERKLWNDMWVSYLSLIKVYYRYKKGVD